MKNPNNRIQKRIFSIVITLCVLTGIFMGLIIVPVFAARPKPIVVTKEEENILKRMQRTITLDVRDMNVVDVIKFLADEKRGDFNVVISPTVQGRVTVYLNNVSIQDALDIIIISNHLAYKIDSNIVQIMSSVEYEAMYGKKFSDQTEVAIIRLKYSRPSYVLAALDNLKSNVGKIIIDEDTGSVVIIDTKEAISLMKEAIKEIEKPLETFVYALQYADAEVVANQLRLRIDAKAVGSITPDTRSNRVIARAYPDRIKEIESIIKELDTPTKEVLVDARILQVVFKPQYDMGIDWKLDFRGSSDPQIQKLSFSNVFLDKANLGSGDDLYKNYGQLAVGNFNVDQFEMSVRAMKQVSETKILSNPKLLVVNKEEAKIHIGDTVPYIISTTSGTGDNAITSEDVRFVDVGLKLNVVPIINDEGFVTMRLRPEISTVVATISSKGGGIPQVNKTEVETSVIVKDGYTIVMGGLKKEDKVHTKKGVPVLMDMPFLGPLFGSTSDNMSNTEIIIFITPTIMTGDEDYTTLDGGIKPFKKYSTD